MVIVNKGFGKAQMCASSSSLAPRPEEHQGCPQIVFLFVLRKEKEVNFS